MISRQVRRWVGLTTGMTIVATLLVVIAPPASAVPNLQLVTQISPVNSEPVKTVEVLCPPHMQVVGGGGQINVASSEDESRVVLTRLVPVVVPAFPVGNISGKYVVTAQAADLELRSTWSVTGYAVCAAGRQQGYLISFNESTPPSSLPEQASVVGCGNGLMIGGGAELRGVPFAQATLQSARSVGQTVDFHVVVGEENASGYDGNWKVISYAICTDPVASVIVNNGPATALNSRPVKTASVSCQFPGVVHGTGAVTGGPAPAGVALTAIIPSNDLTTVTVRAVETTPIGGAWSLAAQASCVTPF